MKWIARFSLAASAALSGTAIAGPFPFPTKKIDAVAEVEVVLTQKAKHAAVHVVRWIGKPVVGKLRACFDTKRALQEHRLTMWRAYWATRRSAIQGKGGSRYRKAKRDWQARSKPLYRLIEQAIKRGRYQAIVYYERKNGVLLPHCGFDDVIFLRHWTGSPEHSTWRAEERKLYRSGGVLHSKHPAGCTW